MSIVEKALGKARAAGPPPLRGPVRTAMPNADIGSPGVQHWTPSRQVAMQAEEGEAIRAFWSDTVDASILNHFRGLRRELLAQLQPVAGTGATPLVLVTSPLPGDGKTFVSAAIAHTFAKAPELRVSLVDLDLVRHSCSNLFGAADLPGLMECVSGDAALADVACATDVPRLTLVPAGNGKGERREAFVGDGVGALFDELRRQGAGSICFLDAPPVLPVVETALLVAKVDLVLLVVRAGQTPQAAVLESLARLGPQARVCIALNSVVHSHTGEYYDYYHYGPSDNSKK